MFKKIKNIVKYSSILDNKSVGVISRIYSNLFNKSKVELVELKRSEIRVYIDGYTLEKLYESYVLFEKIKKTFKNMTIIEIGANIGYFSLLMAYNNNTVYSIEPSKEAMPIMVQNLNKNLDIRDNIITKNIAITDSTGTVNFIDYYKKGLRVKGKILEKEILAYSYSYIVKSVDIDSFLNDFEKVNLLRVNVGGFEYKLFNKINRENLVKIDNIIVDVHPNCKDIGFLERLKKNFDNHSKINIGDGYDTYCFFRSRIF